MFRPAWFSDRVSHGGAGAGSRHSAGAAELGLWLLLLTVGCGGHRPPLVLLTVDTLRADHLSTYGYARATDPNLSRFAERAVIFSRAFTPRPKTTPAYASIFTGLYPYRHGLEVLGDELASPNLTVAELLGQRGFRSYGFVSSTVMVGRLSGLQQGFSLWDDHLPSREASRDNFERKGAETVDRVIASMDRLGGGDLLFVHLIDPHGPYDAPPPFGSAFRGTTPPTREETRALAPQQVPSFQRIPGARTLDDYVNAYDGEVLYADYCLGRLVEALEERGIFDEALVIVTADHGESLGDHGHYFRHGQSLHEPSARVPLLIKPPGGRTEGVPTRWEGAVSLVDVFSTLLDYAGVTSPSGVDGQSLRPIVEGGRSGKGRVVFSTRRGGGWAAHGREGSVLASLCGRAAGGGGELCGARFFDASKDPGQVHPISEGSLFLNLADELRRFVAAASAFDLPFAVTRRYKPTDKGFVVDFMQQHNRRYRRLGRGDRRALKALGYL
ncbi:MAG: sulfatase [Candidatus Binatia bacterium]